MEDGVKLKCLQSDLDPDRLFCQQETGNYRNVLGLPTLLYNVVSYNIKELNTFFLLRTIFFHNFFVNKTFCQGISTHTTQLQKYNI